MNVLTIAGGQTRLVTVYIGDTHIGCPFRDRKPGTRKSAEMRSVRRIGCRACLPTETEPALCGCSSADA